MIFELIKALIIGIIEGITEWLPVSSTGHMIIFNNFVTLNVSPDFWTLFLVVIQLGAIMAVIVLYFHKLNPFSSRKTPVQRRSTLRLWAKVIIACIPAAIIGGLFDNWFEVHAYNAVVVAAALIIYGVVFIVVERIKGSRSPASSSNYQGKHIRTGQSPSSEIADVDNLGFGRAFGVGLFQVLAVVPGTSRSGSTIMGGRILGISREAAAEFSFFLAIPVMFGWSLLKVVKTFLIDHIHLTSTEWGVFVVGIVVAFLVSLVAIRFLMNFIKKHSFEAFGWYRIALGVVVLAFSFLTGTLLL